MFLDEIGTIGPKTQIDLLRAIEKKEFTRLGGNEVLKSDFRIICATNTNLEEAVKTMAFREDLYYRLQVYVIQLQPLRERPEDIPELVHYFIRKYSRKMNKPDIGIDSSALDMLLLYAWNGNVRELENSIESAMVVTNGKKLSKSDFKLKGFNEQPSYNVDLSLAEVEKAHIINVLDRQNWNITSSAKLLGIDRVTIYKKLNKYGINRPENV